MTAPVRDETLVRVAGHHLHQAVVALEAAGVDVIHAVGGPQLGHALGVAGVHARGVGREDPEDRELVLGGGEAVVRVGEPRLEDGQSGVEGIEAHGLGGGSHDHHVNALTEGVNTL